MSLNDLTHDDVRAWLDRALHGQEPLPKLTQDEPAHLGILRLEKSLMPRASEALRDACLNLVRRFCVNGSGETIYSEELFSLTSAFKLPEAVQLLAQASHRFPEWHGTPLEVRLAVLAMLVDTPPPQSVDFWISILRQDKENYASLALSGVLSTNLRHAISLLPEMPNNERAGSASVLKLDLACDDLRSKKKTEFIHEISNVLSRCGERFRLPVAAWVASKEAPSNISENSQSLVIALQEFLGIESSPRTRTPKLCHCLGS